MAVADKLRSTSHRPAFSREIYTHQQATWADVLPMPTDERPPSSDDPVQADDKPLTTDHLAVVAALGGQNSALAMLQAHVLETEGEHRPQQERMLNRVEEAISLRRNLLIQAGTGTGKSLAYAFAAAAAGKRTVIATATNQLSEQLTRKDLPQVAGLMDRQKRPLDFVVLKGRNQYACKARIQEARALGSGQQEDTLPLAEGNDDLSDIARQGKQFAQLMEWVETTQSGERSEAPAVADRVWRQISVSSSECVRSECPFYSDCFAEKARAAARRADLVVTNHALLAQDVRMASLDDETDAIAAPLLPRHEVLIIDEAHAFPSTLSDALSLRLETDGMRSHLRKARRVLDISDKAHSALLTRCAEALDSIEDSLANLPIGVLPNLPEEFRRSLDNGTVQFLSLARALRDASANLTKEGKGRQGTAALMLANQVDDDAVTFSRCRATQDGTVRWVEQLTPDGKPVLCVSPVDVGGLFAAALEGRTLIGTSATLKVGGDFGVQQRAFGLVDCDTDDVGTPFSYPKQGMLYIPKAPFPEPVGKERFEHTAAVLDELCALVEAAGGRALALFTTTNAAIKSAEYLRKQFPGLTVLAHGEAPAESLVREFSEDETSVLCATMGMWQGVSVEGPACSLVVIDKLSFPPPDDPLTQAKREFAAQSGGEGFKEVFVAKAAIDVAQAAGRLIRTSSDRGVVAILDPRILTKRYGQTLIASLPPFPIFTDRKTVTDALTRLTGGLAPNARKKPSKARPKPKPAAAKKVTKAGTLGARRRIPRKQAPPRGEE